MDKSQLIIIAVTAATTAAITVVVKTLTEWLVSLLPGNDRVKAIIARTITKANALVIISLVGFGLTLWSLIAGLRESGPITRGVVVRLCLATFGVLMWFASLMVSAVVVVVELRRRKSSLRRD